MSRRAARRPVVQACAGVLEHSLGVAMFVVFRISLKTIVRGQCFDLCIYVYIRTYVDIYIYVHMNVLV